MKKLLILIILLTGCGSGEMQELDIMEAHYKECVYSFMQAPVYKGILITGDSNTENCGSFYPEYFTGRTANRGISGGRSDHLVRLLDDVIDDEAPLEVFIMIGTNDIGVTSPDDYIDNMITLVEHFTVPVTLISVLPNELQDKANILGVNAILSDIAGRYAHVTYSDRYAEFMDGAVIDRALFLDDDIHLTRAGCMKLFNY